MVISIYMEIDDEIPIEIHDKKLFTLIALVIDRPEIHTELKRLRAVWLKHPGEKDFLTAVHVNTPEYQRFSSAVMAVIKKHHLPIVYNEILLQVVWFWQVDLASSDLLTLFSKSPTKRSMFIALAGRLLEIPLKTIRYRLMRVRKEVRIHRRWYWMWQSGHYRRFENLSNDWNETVEEVEKGKPAAHKYWIADTYAIQKAVKRYTLALQNPLARN